MIDLNEYFQRRYNHLLKTSYNIVKSTKKDRASANPLEERHDLLHWVIELIYTIHEQSPFEDEAILESIIVNKLNTQWNWDINAKASYKKQNRLLNYEQEDISDIKIGNEVEESIIDELTHEGITLEVQNYIEQLREKGFDDEQIEKVLTINVAKSKLDMYELIIFKLYFYDGMSIRQISADKNVSTHFVFKILTSMKNKLKKECKKLLAS